MVVLGVAAAFVGLGGGISVVQTRSATAQIGALKKRRSLAELEQVGFLSEGGGTEGGGGASADAARSAMASCWTKSAAVGRPESGSAKIRAGVGLPSTCPPRRPHTPRATRRQRALPRGCPSRSHWDCSRKYRYRCLYVHIHQHAIMELKTRNKTLLPKDGVSARG